MTSRSTWKGLERKAAKKLGGTRNPLSGRESLHTSGDVIHKDLYVECKLRAQWSVLSLYREVKEEAKKEGKIPILVLKEKGKHGELVVLGMEDFKKLVGEGEVGG